MGKLEMSGNAALVAAVAVSEGLREGFFLGEKDLSSRGHYIMRIRNE
jgi:hypothetical protein